jgi:hypothetical protein
MGKLLKTLAGTATRGEMEQHGMSKRSLFMTVMSFE